MNGSAYYTAVALREKQQQQQRQQQIKNVWMQEINHVKVKINWILCEATMRETEGERV